MATTVPLGGQVPTANPIPMPGVGGASNGIAPLGNVPTPTDTVLPQTGVQANPYAPVGATPLGTTPTVSGLPPGTMQTNNINWVDGSNTVTGDLKDTFGAGTGTAVSSVLQNMGTSNDAAIQAMIANTNLAASKQYGNIQAQEAAAGITPNSSTAGLAAGDFYSTVNSQLQSNIAGMESDQQTQLLQTLLQTGQEHGPDLTGFQNFADMFKGITGLIGGGAQVASGATSAISPGTDTSFLDALGMLAI